MIMSKVRLLIILASVCVSNVAHTRTANLPNGQPNNHSIGVVSSHVFSHSGKILALANDHEILFWNLQKKRITDSIQLPTSYCRYPEMVFAPKDTAIIIIACEWYEYDQGQERNNVVHEDSRGVYSILSINIRN